MDEWLTSAARSRPHHPALVAERGALSYRGLEEAARQAASGIERGALVPLASGGLEFAVALHACSLAGAIAVPVDPRREAPALPLHAGADVHSIVFTSGTGGRPKPVELSYENHEASARALGERLGLGPGDRWLCPLPLFHVGGLAILLRAVIHHSTVVLHERFDPERVGEELETGEITHVSLVPTMLARVRDAGVERAPQLRTVLLGGGPIPEELLGGSLPVVPTYGMTETASAVATGSPGDPLRGVELRTGPGGEILVRGPMVAAGAVDPDGWLRTGDHGHLDAGGRLHVSGRLTDVIVSGGENVSPLRVEQALLTHPAVAEVGVAGLPDPEWGEAVTAFVVLRRSVDSAELIEHCRERLAPFEVPKVVHRLDQLPRTAAGKLRRSGLVQRR